MDDIMFSIHDKISPHSKETLADVRKSSWSTFSIMQDVHIRFVVEYVDKKIFFKYASQYR